METQDVQIAKIETLLKSMNEKIDGIVEKVDHIQDTFIIQTSSKLAVAEEKINRLETIVYGTVSIIFIEVIGLIALFIKK